ncbi:SRPBCC family protein [Aquipuribacter nitratireducens]|uniref:SRPBCC family protein n=1 Tax=Aquipuribacter nitratireducens TaxID=650104 RepID=A0ABW0GQT7_9MICO
MTIRTTRHVGAPAARVHDLLTDVDAWAPWSPHVVSVTTLAGSDPARLHEGWRGRVRPFFGPATTMTVTTVRPEGGYSWSTRALGHRLDYDWSVRPTGDTRCDVAVTADVRGPLARGVEAVVGRLSAFGQRRRAERLAVLAEGWRRV